MRAAGIRHSVGIVGKRESFADIHALRAALPAQTYLWINAWKREANYYTQGELSMLRGIDPHFDLNATPHASLGLACRSGHAAFTVDGAGEARRCHFIPETIGNIYSPGFEHALRPRSCSINECRCHIGYVHLEHLRLDTVYGDGLLERIPMHFGASQASEKA